MKLVDYPLSLRELDVEKLEAAERTFRVRIGRYRLIFHWTRRKNYLPDGSWKKRIRLRELRTKVQRLIS